MSNINDSYFIITFFQNKPPQHYDTNTNLKFKIIIQRSPLHLFEFPRTSSLKPLQKTVFPKISGSVTA